jgi:receptor protein-tyrosine kinase
MSLIERAVGRLAGSDEQQIASQPGSSPGEKTAAPAQSTIEAFTERLSREESGRSGTPVLEAAPAVRPAGPVHVELEPLRSRGFVMPDGEQSRIAQEFRVIKRPLIANALGKGAAPVRNGKRIMVTSAFPGEGKSFVAINLALSIAAERDHKVLLVDADVARPSIPRVLGFEAGAGIMDWLIDGNLDIATLTLQTDVEKLAIIPAGRRHEQATEFLASASMSRLLDQISARFPDRIVIFDSPPLLVTTEARVLAQYMGQIVVVVEAGQTPRSAVNEALSTIDGTAEVIGMLLNKTTGTSSGGYGGYGGYYGYGGYGYGNGKNKVA